MSYFIFVCIQDDYALRPPFSESNKDKWHRYYLELITVMKLAEIQLVLKFPGFSSVLSIVCPC